MVVMGTFYDVVYIQIPNSTIESLMDKAGTEEEPLVNAVRETISETGE